MIFGISTAAISTENKAPGCAEVLEACNLYVQDLEEYNGKMIRQLQEKNKRITELEEGTLGISWYWYLAAGAIGGYLLAK